MENLEIIKNIPYLGDFFEEIPMDTLEQLIQRLGVEICHKSDTTIQIHFKGRPEEEYFNIVTLLDGICIGNWGMNDIDKLPLAKNFRTEHSNVVIHYCIRGRCEIQVYDGKYAYMEPGVLCVEWHQDVNKRFNFYGEKYCGLEIAFDLERFKDEDVQFLDRLGISMEKMWKAYEENADYYIGTVTERLKKSAEELAELVKAGEADSYTYLIALVGFLNLIRIGNVKTDRSRFYLTRGQRKIVTEVYTYFASHLNTDMTVEQMAKHYNLSAVSLNKYFEIMYGDTINRYMLNYRLERAAGWLAETKESVAEIALAAGYQNQSKFSSAFKKKYSQTPIEYRRCNSLTEI